MERTPPHAPLCGLGPTEHATLVRTDGGGLGITATKGPWQSPLLLMLSPPGAWLFHPRCDPDRTEQGGARQMAAQLLLPVLLLPPTLPGSSPEVILMIG